jgi:CheY-like chemotaxis protein
LKILVLDDDRLVLSMFERMLRDHEPTLVAAPEEALTLIRDGRSFDAILCDMHMPGMTGQAFFYALCRLRPELAKLMVFMSGASCTSDENEFLESQHTLMKPFRLADLETLLARTALTHGSDSRPAPAPGSL